MYAMAKQMTNNRLKRVRPYQGFRDYGPEMFALELETSEGNTDDLKIVQ